MAELPDCIVINPKLGRYPFPHLAGVGVALKLAHALLEERQSDRVELPLALRPFLDVVAVGTVADVVPLTDENRSLVAMGIGRLRSSPRPGLAALLEVADTAPSSVDASTIGFRLAPRLNAAGRLDDAAQAVDLLGAADRATALPLAQRLGQLNAERQEIEAAILREALAMLPEPLPAALVLSSPDWHEGVVGIVAARVVEQTGRPTILLSQTDGVAKGSGRSIPEFDLLAGVAACSHVLLGFGGHKAACGLRLPVAAVRGFAEALAGYAGERLGADQFRRVTTVDALAAGDQLTLGLTDELDLFAPHGIGNPRPVIMLHGAELAACRLTRNGRHMQCDVRLDGVTVPGVRFGFSAVSELAPGTRYDVPVAYVKNAFNGIVRPQAQVKGATALPAVARRSVRRRLWRRLRKPRHWRRPLAGSGRGSRRGPAGGRRRRGGGGRRGAARRGSPLRPPPPPHGFDPRRHRGGRRPHSSCWSPTSLAAGRCSRAMSSCRSSASPTSI